MDTFVEHSCNSTLASTRLHNSAFASNRDECLDRPTSHADFWNVQTGGSDTQVGVLCGVDRKPARANLKSDQVLPGTWVGITTEGDLIALTDYLEDPSYYKNKPPGPPKPSRGQLCGDFLVSMAESGPGKKHGHAEKWARGYARDWETAMEGFNLLVVQGAGEQQYVGANREGLDIVPLHNLPERHSVSSDRPILKRLATMCNQIIRSTLSTASPKLHPTRHSPSRIAKGTVTGLSNSIFSRPWRRVEIGSRALEAVLDESLARFGSGRRASCPQSPSDVSSEKESKTLDDDTRELVWLVIETLTLLRVHTKPYPKVLESYDAFTSGLQDRVFVPRTDLEPFSVPHVKGEYGTRSSTVVLFGRNGQAVYVEKNWYAPRCLKTGERRLFAADSVEGVVWWQGKVGQPRDEWKQIQGHELECLFRIAREPVHPLLASEDEPSTTETSLQDTQGPRPFNLDMLRQHGALSESYLSPASC
ncbi:hypothetical protein BGX31_000038 [Mortierella sp. GBA43]|nr:hypothetical protein BGX31_000038 [Mortierella sp. GBA43]